MDPPFCHVLSNCMSGWEFTYNLGNVCVVSLFGAQGTVSVFKDIVLFSRNPMFLFSRSRFGKKPARIRSRDPVR